MEGDGRLPLACGAGECDTFICHGLAHRYLLRLLLLLLLALPFQMRHVPFYQLVIDFHRSLTLGTTHKTPRHIKRHSTPLPLCVSPSPPPPTVFEKPGHVCKCWPRLTFQTADAAAAALLVSLYSIETNPPPTGDGEAVGLVSRKIGERISDTNINKYKGQGHDEAFPLILGIIMGHSLWKMLRKLVPSFLAVGKMTSINNSYRYQQSKHHLQKID